MAEWTRNNSWRQGSVLSIEAMKSLGLVNTDTHAIPMAVVITHDCDLAEASGRDNNVEVIVGQFIEQVKGDYAHAKNARCLQLEYRCGEHAVAVELKATAKALVEKKSLASFEPRAEMKLDARGHSILQTWLAARYRRSAFPEEFESRLKTAKLHRKIGKAMERSGQNIIAIFFDVDQGEERFREGPDDMYELGVYLLYDTTQNAIEAHTIADQAAKEITAAFKTAFQAEGSRAWKQINLLYCEAMSDQAMTYAQSRLFKQWRLEYMSLEDTPAQPMIDE